MIKKFFSYLINEDIKVILCRNKGRYFFLDLNSGLCAEIDYFCYETLINWNGLNDKYVINKLKNKIDVNVIKNSISNFKKIKDKNTVRKNMNSKKQNNSFTNLWLHITNKCNLNCDYCFHSDGKKMNIDNEMSLYTAMKIVDFFMDNTDSTFVNVQFIGGEPTVKFDLIVKIVKYINKKALASGIRTGYSLTTNAVSITSDMVDFFNKNNFKITVSIDGDKENHNIHRKFKNELGSYSKVEKGVKLLRKKMDFITAKITLTKTTISNFNYIINYIFDLGFDSISYQFVGSSSCDFTIDKEHFLIFKNDLGTVFNNFKKDILSGEFKIIDRLIGWMQKIYQKPIRNECTIFSDKKLVVDTNGNFYRCEMAVGNEDFVIGNLKDGINLSESKPLMPPLLKERPICTDCWLNTYCDGGCYYSSYLKYGHFNKPDKISCMEIKDSFIKSLSLYTSLYIYDFKLIEILFANRFDSKEDIRSEIKEKYRI